MFLCSLTYKYIEKKGWKKCHNQFLRPLFSCVLKKYLWTKVILPSHIIILLCLQNTFTCYVHLNTISGIFVSETLLLLLNSSSSVQQYPTFFLLRASTFCCTKNKTSRILWRRRYTLFTRSRARYMYTHDILCSPWTQLTHLIITEELLKEHNKSTINSAEELSSSSIR